MADIWEKAGYNIKEKGKMDFLRKQLSIIKDETGTIDTNLILNLCKDLTDKYSKHSDGCKVKNKTLRVKEFDSRIKEIRNIILILNLKLESQAR